MTSDIWPYNEIIFSRSRVDMMDKDTLMAWDSVSHSIYIKWGYVNDEVSSDPYYIANDISHEVMHGVIQKILLDDKFAFSDIWVYQNRHYPFIRGLDDDFYLRFYAPVADRCVNGFKSCPINHTC